MTTESSYDQPTDFDKMWDYSDPKETEEKFRGLLHGTDAKGDAAENDSYRWQLLTQIARAQGLQRKFEDAHKTLDEVEAQLDAAEPIVRIRYLLERGRVHNSSKQPETARPMFVEAWHIACDAGADVFAVDAAHMMGIIEPSEEALRWNERALKLAKSSESERARGWLGSLYNNIGWTYHDQGDYEKALDLFEKALACRQQRNEAEPTRVAKWCVARVIRSLGRIQEALALQEELLSEHEASGGKDGYVFEELAECHLALDHPETAPKYFALAYAELSQDPWLAGNEAERIERLKRLGGIS